MAHCRLEPIIGSGESIVWHQLTPSLGQYHWVPQYLGSMVSLGTTVPPANTVPLGSLGTVVPGYHWVPGYHSPVKV